MSNLRTLCMLALLFSARIAAAQLNPGMTSVEDVIALRDGTILRGRVAEMRPGDHVEIVLLDGRSQTIPWSEIVSRAGPSFPEARLQLADRWLKPSPGREPVIVESTGKPLAVGVLQARPMIGQESETMSDGFNLEQLTTDWQSRAGVVVCTTTPCQLYARPGELQLQTSGPGIFSSTAEVTVPPGGLRVKLRAPTVAGRRLGIVLLGASIAGLVGAPILFGMAAAFGSDKSTQDAVTINYALGGVFLGLGVLTAVPGIVLIALNRPGIASIEPLTGTIHF